MLDEEIESESIPSVRKKRSVADSAQDKAEYWAKFAKQGDDLLEALKAIQEDYSKYRSAAYARRSDINRILILSKCLAMEKSSLQEIEDPEEKGSIIRNIETIQQVMREISV
jgi:hypothetical protein